MADERLKEFLNKKLEGYSRPVPQSVWERIESRLPKIIAWYRRPLYVAAVAVLAIAAVTFSVRLINYAPKSITPDDIAIVDSVCDVEQIDIIETHPVAVDNVLSDDTVLKEKSVVVKHRYCSSTRPNDKTERVMRSVDDTAIDEDISVVINEYEMPVLDSKEQVYACGECEESVIEESDCVSSEMSTDSVIQEVNRYYEQNYYDNVIIKPCKDNSTLAFVLESYSMPTASSVTTFPLRCGGEAELVFNHKLPFNVKALVEKSFDRWSLGTGISYTYMSSDYKMSYNWRVGRQELHYLGVPVYLKYSFAEVKRFSFYASVGGQIDINVSARHQESPESHLYDCLGSKTFRDKHPQFSALVGVGAAFNIVQHLDVYVEPSLGYYFNNDSFVHTIWQDRSFNVGVSLGLRSKF